MAEMTSRERMLAALKRQDVDYIPCSIYFNKNMKVYGYNPENVEDAVNFHLKLGLDPVVNLPGIPVKMHPSVKTCVWIEEVTGEKYPILYKKYATQAGVLRRGIRLTPEWPYGNDIPFPGNDFCASNCYEPLIKTPEDIDVFEYLMCPPEDKDLELLTGNFLKTKAVADKYCILTAALAGEGLATLLFLMGAQNLIYFAMDYPEAFKRMAEIVSCVTKAKIKLYARAGVDLLKRFGGYEQTNFFTPAIFKTVVEPVLRCEMKIAGEAGIHMYYRVVTGMKPLLGRIADIGFDCVEGFEPCLSDCSNRDIKNALGGKTCLWTGISSPGHIGAEGEATVRNAVYDAMQTFGRQGFILGVTNSIRAHWSWNNTLAMIEEWKKLR